MTDGMMDLAEAARAVGGRVAGNASTRFDGVTTDSRAVRSGDLFVAISGERFDGHGYVQAAARAGAVAALTSREVEASPIPQVVSKDSRLALGHLARHWRARFGIPVVALTGSNGKTTVKEMLAAILRTHAKSAEAVLATEGNLNNDIGMPVTLLRLRAAHRYAVIEMGMNHEGEIAFLTRLAIPGVALVNNAHRAHVGILGSVEAIARAKGEIYQGLPESGVAVVNEDDAFAGYWKGLNPGQRVVTFGFGAAADVRGEARGGAWHVTTPSGAFEVTLKVAGAHNAANALAACAAAHALAIPTEAMRAGLAAFEGVPGRLQRCHAAGGGLVIDDSYNANPDSMDAALRVLAQEAGRRVLVLGDMGELGEGAAGLHAEVGRAARAAGIDGLLALGEMSRATAEAFGAGARHFGSIEAIAEAARAESAAGAKLLVKGSRFMRMERVCEALGAGGGSHAA